MPSEAWSSLGFSRLGGVLSAAVLLVLAQPPFDLFPLAVVALVPLAIAVGSLPDNPSGAWTATVLGGAFGSAYWGWTLVWIPAVVAPHFSWAYPGYLLLLSILVLLSALCGRLIHAFHGAFGLTLGLALPLAWVGVEWAKAHFPFGLAFPWMGLSLGFSSQPDLLGVAEWIGESGVSFWLAGVNGMIAMAVMKTRVGKGRRAWAGAALALFIPAVLGLSRARTLPLSPGPTVAVVGTRVPAELRVRPDLAGAEAISQVLGSVGSLVPGAADLVVIPEGTIPVSIQAEQAAGLLEDLIFFSGAVEAPVVFGGLGGDGPGQVGAGLTNSAFLLSYPPSDESRAAIQVYDKARLVPGMESGSYRRGGRQSVFVAGDWTYGPLVCYESLFGGSARRAKTTGAEVLINLSSDIWFGHEGSLVGSLFLTQHPAHLVLRAIETRSPVVRAANGGFSFLLDPRGHKASETVSGEGDVVRNELTVYEGKTLFIRTGDWVGPVCALLSASVLFLVGMGYRRRVGTGRF